MDEEVVDDDCSEICALIRKLIDDVIEESTKESSASSCEKYTRDKRSLQRKNEANGLSYVEELMQKWNRLPELKNWHYKIDHIDVITSATLKYHAFRIKWDKPMEGYSHPIIVINVYLYLKVMFDSVEMSYHFEGYRFVRDARYFNPKWLLDAHDDKSNVIASLSL